MALFRCGKIDGGSGLSLVDRCAGNNARLWEVWNIATNNPSQVIYQPTADTYFMLPATTPMSLLLKPAAFTGGTKYGLKANTIRFNPYVNNSGRMATHANYATSTVKRINVNQPCMQGDYSNTATSWLDISENTGDLITSPLLINGLEQSNTHPALYRIFANMGICKLSDLFDGTERLTIDDIFENTMVPSGFNLNNITQGYFLFYGGNYNFIVSEASSTQVYVDSNGKLNSTTAPTYQTTAITLGDVSSTKLDKRLYYYNAKIYGADGNYTIENSMVFSTEDIYDTNNNLVFEANATLQEFKNVFNLAA